MHRRALLLLIAAISTAAPAPVAARRDCAAALAASGRLTAALLSRDTIAIRSLVRPETGYGHSNGWIESRDEMTRDLFDGTLRYDAIRLLDSPSCVLQHRTAIIRHRVAVAIVMKGAALQMSLGVLQVWQWRSEHWTLLARQSCRIS